MKIINPHNVRFSAKCYGDGTIILGKNSQIREGTIIEMDNGLLEIGDESIIGYNSFFQSSGHIIIGKFCLLGPYNTFMGSTHVPTKGINLKLVPLQRSKLVIHDNVWSGAHVTFNNGIIISKNSIVGANSFVNKNVPENEVWGGVPIKFLKGNIY